MKFVQGLPGEFLAPGEPKRTPNKVISVNSSLGNQPARNLRAKLWQQWTSLLEQREEQVFVALSILIGALVGLVVVAFIVLTERLGMRLYPVGSPAWRRVLFPVAGSLTMGLLLYRYFPNARGSGVPQTKAALFARDGFISLRTVLGKFFCTSATLASGIPLGREGPSVQVGAGIASLLVATWDYVQKGLRLFFRWELRRQSRRLSIRLWRQCCSPWKR